jgi:glycosyltransferase involved in cell wall biosynthesis
VVSIIIPAYNALRWLPETLASVAAQAGIEKEVIIVDDGSTDGTAAYLEKEWHQFSLIRTHNLGVSHARNIGTEAAQGEWIQYLDADDLLMPGKLSRQVQLMREHSEADVIYSNWQRLNEDDDGQFRLGEKICRKYEDIHADPEIAFFSAIWCPTGAYLYRRNFLNKLLPWKEWLPVIQDARFAWDAAAAGAHWLHDPEISVLYRQHRSGSVSTRNRRAFLLDCVANMDDIRSIWELKGQLSHDRKDVLIKGYESSIRGMYLEDVIAFRKLYQRVLEFEPKYRPSNCWLRVASIFLGYEGAEMVSHHWRKLKNKS